MRRLLTIVILTLILAATMLPATVNAGGYGDWRWFDCKTAQRQEILKQFACFAVLFVDGQASVEVPFGSPSFVK